MTKKDAMRYAVDVLEMALHYIPRNTDDAGHAKSALSLLRSALEEGEEALPFDRYYVFGYLGAGIQHGLEMGDADIEAFADWLVPDTIAYPTADKEQP